MPSSRRGYVMKKIGLIVFGLIWGCAWASAEVNGTCTIQKVVFSVGGKALLSGYILSGINGLTVTSEDYFLDAMELPGNETWGPVCTGTKEKLLFLSYVLGKNGGEYSTTAHVMSATATAVVDTGIFKRLSISSTSTGGASTLGRSWPLPGCSHPESMVKGLAWLPKLLTLNCGAVIRLWSSLTLPGRCRRVSAEFSTTDADETRHTSVVNATIGWRYSGRMDNRLRVGVHS